MRFEFNTLSITPSSVVLSFCRQLLVSAMHSFFLKSSVRTCGTVLFLLLSACQEKYHPETVQRPASPVSTSFVSALLLTGLVAKQHQRWLFFADTTRHDMFQLGHTPRQVRGWLADYEERLAEKQTLNPDSVHLHVATEAELRHPPPIPPMVKIVRFPNTPAERVLARTQTIQLTHQLRRAGLLTTAEYRRTLPLARAGAFYSRRDLLLKVNEFNSTEDLQQRDALPR